MDGVGISGSMALNAGRFHNGTVPVMSLFLSAVGGLWPVVVVFVLALAPVAYLALTFIDLREGIVAWRAHGPCAAKLVKAVCYAVLFLKLLLM